MCAIFPSEVQAVLHRVRQFDDGWGVGSPSCPLSISLASLAGWPCTGCSREAILTCIIYAGVLHKTYGLQVLCRSST